MAVSSKALAVSQSQEVGEASPILNYNPNEHLIQIPNGQGKTDYLPVQWRMVWFRSLCPEGTIETEMVLLDLDRETEEETYAWNNDTRRKEKVIKRANGLAVFRARVTDGNGGIATATKSEKAASFGDFIEKAETGAVGRALAMLGYGTQFAALEFDESHRIVDAPVERRQTAPQDEQKAYQQRRPVVEADKPKAAPSNGNGHKGAPVESSDVASPLPDADAPTPQELRRRHAAYKEAGATKATFEDFLKWVFHRPLTDEELTPAYCLVVAAKLAAYEQKAKAS